MSYTIVLNKTEQRLCRHIARGRNKINREGNIKNSKIGNQDDYLTDLEGFGGELAFCKLFNIFPDMKIKITNQNNDIGDCKIGKFTIDVKTTKYETGKLLAPRWKKNNIDYYALMTGTFPKYTFKGFMRGTELIKKSRLTDLGHGKGYCADQSELKIYEKK